MVHLFHGRELHDLGSRLSDSLHDEVPYFVHGYNLPSFEGLCCAELQVVSPSWV